MPLLFDTLYTLAMTCTAHQAAGVPAVRRRCPQTRLRRPLACLWLAALALFPGPLAVPQDATEAADATEAPRADTISVAEVEARLEAVQENTSLDEAARARLTDLYTQTLEHLQTAEKWRAEANEFEERRTSADETIAAIQEELASPSEVVAEEPAAITDVTQLELKVAEWASNLAAAQAELADLEKQSAQRAERRRLVPALQADARQRLEEVRGRPQIPAGNGESPEYVEARRILTEARETAVEQELRAYEEELLSYDARGRLLSLRLDRARRRVESARSAVDQWRERLTERRQREALDAWQTVRNPEFERKLEENEAPVAVREQAAGLLADIEELIRKRTGADGTLRKLETADARIRAVTETLSTIESDFAALQKRVEAAGSSSVIGVLLRGHRRNLPDTKAIESRIRARQQELSTMQIAQIEAEEERRDLFDIDALVQDVLAETADELEASKRAAIADVLRELYTAKRDALDTRISNFENYFEKLLVLNANKRRLVTAVEEFRSFINQRVLWVRSGDAISVNEWPDIVQALRWLLHYPDLAALAHALLTDLSHTPIRVAALLLFALALNASRWLMRRRIARNAEKASDPDCVSIRPTVDAALYSLAVSAGLPLLIALVGWRCTASLASTEYTRIIGAGLMGTAFVLWSLEFCREVFRRKGLGMAHFGWSESACLAVARHVLYFEWVAVPLLVLVAIFDVQVDQPWQVSLGRLALVLVLLALAFLAHRLLRYRNGPLLDVIERARRRSNLILRRVWYFIAVGAPLVLLGAAAAGYYYSALQITTKTHATLVCAFCLLVFFQIIMRAMLLARRSLARQRARKKKKKKPAAMLGVSTVEPDIPEASEELDLDRIGAQTMRLIRSAFVISLAACTWVIWADDVSALIVLDRVELWTVAAPASDAAATETAAPAAETGAPAPAAAEEEGTAITLWDAAVFFFIIAITFIAVQNLPGLLEIVLLQRLSLIAGERYAINMIVGYVLTIIGITWAFSSIGLGWGRLQWLIAAVGLGLGFGLQEIFANLVSGLILLFERPVRVGDIVTVGNVSGTVTRIRIRATSITAFNRQELIVPNKEFVTGQLINWTLSDQVLRLEMPVGIAYGSDVALAKKLMLEVARSHPKVMEDPEPKAYFFGFGDSSLDFEVRAHTDADSFLDVKDALHSGIEAAFREHGIEIPFPQRDLHVRSIRAPLQVEGAGNLPPGDADTPLPEPPS